MAAIAGSFIGLLIGGILAPIDWRLVFLVCVPFGVFGTIWAYLKLVDNGVRIPAKIDWAGNITFAAGLIAVLTGIVYGIQPYGGHTMGWTNPFVLGDSSVAWPLLAVFVPSRPAPRPDVPAAPVPHPGLQRRQRRQSAGRAGPGRPAVHAHHLAARHLAPRSTATASSAPRCGPGST